MTVHCVQIIISLFADVFFIALFGYACYDYALIEF